MSWAVKLDCRAGTWHLRNGGWDYDYHVITWTIEGDEQVARDLAADLRRGNRDVRAAWAEPLPS